MKALIIGYNKFTDEKFSYELDNVVAVLTLLDNITIQNIKNEKLISHTYYKDDVKIVIENQVKTQYAINNKIAALSAIRGEMEKIK